MKITSFASCQRKKHIQNSLFVLPLPQLYCTTICRNAACCRKSHHTPATLAPAHTPCFFAIDLHTVRQHLVITHFLLLLLSGTLFQIMSGVFHHSFELFFNNKKTDICEHFNVNLLNHSQNNETAFFLNSLNELSLLLI